VGFSKELNLVLANFHQDFFRFAGPEEDIIGALGILDGRGRAALRVFLDDLLSRSLDAGALQRLWWASPAEIVLTDPQQISAMLQMIRTLIDDPRLASAP
jgi:hypothetical protein